MSTNTESRSAEAETESGGESEFSKDPCLRNWLELPHDVTASILLRLGAIEIIESAQKVCTQWRHICKDPSMWRSIDMSNSDFSDLIPYDLRRMCMHAVDRSSGGLVNINIEHFGTDELLTYIAQRTSNLRRLRLVNCWGVTDEGLSEAATKFPLLEELEICSGKAGKDAIEVVGRCCPLLKTFKYNQKIGVSSYDEEALAIAENMHGLCHLQLIRNKLTNRGLQAILDGCPYLESLDLRKCFHVDLEGEIGKRCAEQIKNLRLPNDSSLDDEFDAESNGTGYSNYDYLSSDFSYDDYGLGYDYDDYDGYDSGSNNPWAYWYYGSD